MSVPASPTSPPPPGRLAKFYRLTVGKIRRFYLHKFRRGYIEEFAAKREGTCGRCAACCKLLFRCPFLDESGPLPTCSIHDRRPDNCRFFPIDPRDLADRDFIDPENPCGFSFRGHQAESVTNGQTIQPAPPLPEREPSSDPNRPRYKHAMGP